MSKQSEAKLAQGFSKEPQCCRTCARMKRDLKPALSGAYKGFLKGYRACAIGGFAVKSTNSCKLWEAIW